MNRTYILVAALVISIGLNLFLGINYFNDSTTDGAVADTQDQSSDDDADTLVQELSELVLLPEAEQPSIIELEEIDELKQQQPEFYANAQSGDLVFVYESFAVIYRRLDQKVVSFQTFSE